MLLAQVAVIVFFWVVKITIGNDFSHVTEGRSKSFQQSVSLVLNVAEVGRPAVV